MNSIDGNHESLCRGAIFDLDGTLLDTIDDITSSMNHALNELSMAPLDAPTFMSFVGNGIQVLAEKTLGERADEAGLAEDLLARFRAHYNDNIIVKTTIYDGIRDVLNDFTERGIPMGIVSNKHYALTTKCVDLTLSEWKFAAIIGAKGKFPKKPDPSSVLHVSSLMELEPSECIYVGDTGVDMLTAKNAGMKAVGVLWGFRSEDELKRDGAEILLKTPQELKSLCG